MHLNMCMSDFFCPLPWIHQFVQIDGIKMCCNSNKTLNTSIEEFKNSNYIVNIRNQIKQGVVPEECQSCILLEQQGQESTRTRALIDYPTYKSTNIQDNLEYLDLRYSNLCNFKCRSCSSTFSSSIEKENIIHNIRNHRFDYRHEYKKILADLKQNIHTIKRINFTGGEPLLIKENEEILKLLIDNNRTDVEILITTNASVFNEKLLKLFSNFKNIHWTISLDAISDAAEYIRNGTKWNNVKTNIDKIISLNQSVAFNCTLTTYSCLFLSSLVEFIGNIKTNKTTQPIELWFGFCNSPREINPLNMPAEFKDRVMLEINRSLDIISKFDNNKIESIRSLQSLAKLIQNIPKYQSGKDFYKFTNFYDNIRAENFDRLMDTARKV